MNIKVSQKSKIIGDSVVFITYIVLLSVVMLFHEPWFDEAQAWLIARDASIKEIITIIPHYEGHPPVWHLILMPLAKLDFPYEWSIKAVNLLFSALAMGLVIYQSPFHRLIRYSIPFTYFFFYQYGVISRPYSLMMFGFVLAALYYRERNQKPYRFVFASLIICSTSAYGIVLVAGIAGVWVVEAFSHHVRTNSLRMLINDKRLPAWLLLLTYNILLLLMIYPLPDTFAVNIFQSSNRLVRLFYLLLIAPADATSTITYYNSTITIEPNAQLVASFIVGLIINCVMMLFTAAYKKLYLFTIPYLFFSLFGGIVYFYIHHVGIVVLFYLFIIWVCVADSNKIINLLSYFQRHIKSDRELVFMKTFLYLVIMLPIVISLYWNVTASLHDIIYPYDPGKAIAAYIKDNNLDDLRIMSKWAVFNNEKTGESFKDYNLVYAVSALPYFGTNIYINLNGGDVKKSYLTHQLDKEGLVISSLREQGLPELILELVDIQDIYGDSTSLKDYALIQIIPSSTIWKSMTEHHDHFIFMRRDLLFQYPYINEVSYKKNE